MRSTIEFTKEDYDAYVSYQIGIEDLSQKYGCTKNQAKYQFQKFMENNNFPNRRTIIQSNRNDTYFDKIDTSQKAYILGFYLADGCISNNRLSFAQTLKDAEILNDIRNEIYPECKLKDVKEKRNKNNGYISKPCKFLQMYSVHICGKLREYFGDKKTYSEHTLKNIIPDEFLHDFIRGYFDGDGCISFSYITRKRILKDGSISTLHNINKQWFIVSHTKNVLDEISEYMKSHNITTNVFQEKRGGNYLISTSSYPEIKKIYDVLYYDGCMCLQRKKNKFEELIKEMSKERL